MSDEKPNPNDSIVSPFYPLILYKDGSQFVWDGRATDSKTVETAEEHEAALSQGWVEGKDYPNAGKSVSNLLDMSAGKIADLLPTWRGSDCGSARDRIVSLIDQKQAELAARIAELTAFAAQLQTVRNSFDAAPAPISCRSDLTCCVPPSESSFVPVELLKLSRP